MSKANLSPNDQSVDIITIVNRMLNVPLVFTSVVGNSLVLSTEISNSFLRSTSVVLLCSLTVSDLVVGPLIVQPLYIAARNSQRYHYDGLLFLRSFFRYHGTDMHRSIVGCDMVTSPGLLDALILIWLVHFVLLTKVLGSTGIYFRWRRVNISLHHGCQSPTFASTKIVRRHQRQIHHRRQAMQSLNAPAATALKFLSNATSGCQYINFFISV